jgi:AcrR family transcriptional regulator
MPTKRPYVIDPAPGPKDRRELKKARTRDDLVEAAVKLFAERGFDGTTVEDIAEAANVSPRTFFRYFATKEEVLFHRKDLELASLEAALAARPAVETPLEAVRGCVVEYMGCFQDEEEFHLYRFMLANENPIVEAYGLRLHQDWIRSITKAIARRMGVNPREDLRPGMLAGCAIIAMRESLGVWARSRGQRDIRKLAAEAFDLLAHGFEN